MRKGSDIIMKNYKKTISLIAAMAILFTFVLPIIPAGAEGSGKITVNAPDEGSFSEELVLKAYKILDIESKVSDSVIEDNNIPTPEADLDHYIVKIPDGLLPMYQSLGKIGVTSVSGSTTEDQIIDAIKTLAIDKAKGQNAGYIDQFAVGVLKALKSDPYKSLVTAESGELQSDNTSYVFDDLPLGYFLVAEDLSNVDEDDIHMMAGVILTPAANEATVTAKLEDEPKIQKKIVVPTPAAHDTNEENHDRQTLNTMFGSRYDTGSSGNTVRSDYSNVADTWDMQKGEFVMFRIDVTLPDSDLKDFTADTYKLVARDTLSKGLTLVAKDNSGHKEFIHGSNNMYSVGAFIDVGNGTAKDAGDGIIQDGTDEKLYLQWYDLKQNGYGTNPTNPQRGISYQITENPSGTTDIEFDLSKMAYYWVTNKPETRGKNVIILYYAQLNDQAVIGDKGNPNEVYLSYSNDPSVDTSDPDNWVDTPKDYVDVFTFGLKPRKIVGGTGTDSQTTPTPIQGVQFRMYYLQRKNDGNYEKAYLRDNTASKIYEYDQKDYYTWDTNSNMPQYWKTFTTGADGTIEIPFLEPGIYYLEELNGTAGSDYSPLPTGAVFKVEIKAEVDEWTVADGTGTIGYSEEPHYSVSVSLVTHDAEWQTKGPEGDKVVHDGREYASTGAIGSEGDDAGYAMVNIANYRKGDPGIPLPGTGGAGRNLLYMLGAIVLIGAGILLVTKRRMNIGV